MSTDGRYVAFESTTSDLVANDTNGATDVFVYDRHDGTTTIVSVDSAGDQSNNDFSSLPIAGVGGNRSPRSAATGDTWRFTPTATISWRATQPIRRHVLARPSNTHDDQVSVDSASNEGDADESIGRTSATTSIRRLRIARNEPRAR